MRPRWANCGGWAAAALLAWAVPAAAQPLPTIPGLEPPPSTALQPPRLVDDPRNPGVPLPKLDPSVVLPDGTSVALPATTRQIIRFAPRYGRLNDYVIDPVGTDVQRLTYAGGLIVNVIYLPDTPNAKPTEIEFATDNAVIWVKGAGRGSNILGGLRTDKAKDGKKEEKISVEAYLSGNVVIRSRSEGGAQGPSEQTLRAEEVFYDIDNSKAIALCADLETRFENGFDPIHVKAKEIDRLGQHEYKAYETIVYSSRRPSDPALVIRTAEATLTDEPRPPTNIFGRTFRDARTGDTGDATQKMISAQGNRVELLGVPIAAFPRYRAPLDDPAGPLLGIGLRNDQLFGTQIYTSWDIYKLFALRSPPNTRAVLNIDYLSLRGLGGGIDYDYQKLFGPDSNDRGAITSYIMRDKGADVIGGSRGDEPDHKRTRGRFDWWHLHELYENGATYGNFMGQLAYQSDKNFYEQYYKLRFDQDVNQETFGYFYGAMGNAAGSALVQATPNRPWMTETQWLPRLDGALVGQSLFDRFSYTARANAGYARFRSASVAPDSSIPSEVQSTDTLRAGVNQRLSLPFDLGPLRIEPYGVADTTFYSQDINRESVGRLYGAGGIKASIPFSRLYEDVRSETFNLRGLYHKIDYGVNYYVAGANRSSQSLPLLDRLNDDSIDLTSRTFRANAPLLIPGSEGLALTGSPLYNPQLLAVRRLLDTKSETLDNISVVQAEVRNRWQTKRGLPGADHTVDYLGLDLSASFFPAADRDNFGNPISFLEYNGFWNIGDRMAFTSQGWYDPYSGGVRYFNANVSFNRPDGTNFVLGYRQTDPLGSKALLAILSYQLSQKYSVSISNVYDFGTNQAQSTTFNFSRTGTDVTVAVGFTYNAFINNFGLQLLVLPNAAAPKFGKVVTGMYQ